MRFTNFKNELLVAICQEADLKSHYIVEIEYLISKYSFDYEDWYWFNHGIGNLKDADLLIEYDQIPELAPVRGRVAPTPAGFREAASLSAAGITPVINEP